MAAEEYGALNAELAEPEELAAEVVLAYDGLSPTAKVEETEAGAKITVVDKHGTTTATVKNGKDGATGAPGAHIGPEAPTNGEKLWVDTDEAPEESETEGGTQIDVVAKAGQLLSVAEVDADGKPTKWQAVDLPKAETPNFAANEGEKGYIEGRTHYVDEKGIVHKLDNKFIDADWMATKQDGGAGKTVFIPEQTVSNGLWENLQADLVGGTAYAVEVNGVLYKCVCKVFDEQPYLGNGSLWGDTATAHNNEPFAIVQGLLGATTGTLYTDGTLSDPIGIKVTNWLDTVYNKLPEEYLPDCVVKNVDGKPFGKGAGELLYETTATFDTDAAAASGKRETNVALSPTDGAEYWLEVNGKQFKCLCEETGTNEFELSDATGTRWAKVTVVFSTKALVCVYAKTAGTYSYKLYDVSDEEALDPAYIPQNVARKYDIPDAVVNPASAKVGQTIIVEEVDAEGKPTKWKAADYQPRTHWASETNLMPETTVTFSETIGDFSSTEFTIIVGEQYRLTIDGQSYETTAYLQDGMPTVSAGCIAVADGTAADIGIVVIELTASRATAVISLDKLSVEQIPTKYIPNSTYYIDVTTADDGTMSIAETLFDLLPIFYAGGLMVARNTTNNDNGGIVTKYYNPVIASLLDEGLFLVFAASKIAANSYDLVVIRAAIDGTVSVTDNLG